MSEVIEILKKGLQTSVQGNYRYGYFGQGIPPSGPMDEYSHHIGNVLVGNKPDAASLEITMVGDRIKFLSDTVFAITGANFSAKLNKQPIKCWRTYRVKAGDILDLGFSTNGCRGYLSIAGGFNVPVVMGSTSTYAPGLVGGHKGRYLIEGDILESGESAVPLEQLEGLAVADEAIYKPESERTLYITLGPQADLYKDESVKEFFDIEWEVSPILNRTGVRLTGTQLYFKDRIKDPDEGKDLSNIIDDGIPVGGMQTPSGKEIICMAKDVVTAGGFAKIGTVVTYSMNTVGQLRPGDKVKFKEISLEEAKEKLMERRAKYSKEYITKYE